MNLPPSWSRMHHRQRCFYLVDSHQAKDFADACAKLAKPRVKRSRSQPLTHGTARLTWYQKEGMA